MGTEFDHFGTKAATRYFEEKLERSENLSIDEAEALDNRRLLYHIMTSQGFTNYLEEWWHFDFGDQFWGKISGKRSVYSGRESVV
jgi:D-alanyl-D-alanine dipeptidase